MGFVSYAIAGGNWNEGAHCGSACLNLNANAWNTNGNVGVRGFSDALSNRESLVLQAT
ncbi:hypothetical protein [Hydrogenovibrio marinus]|uniref:hypothetical protein n=1 Tax=Hydrogenovibrio marinus TaxID=28885 RepID=UPI001252C05A|nr:hypothetical protein [Hydrogenovibrio marinus]BBN59300.1 hypothetical protein HVMH_0894 [Hydrogenovibrio marinus]